MLRGPALAILGGNNNNDNSQSPGQSLECATVVLQSITFIQVGQCYDVVTDAYSCILTLHSTHASKSSGYGTLCLCQVIITKLPECIGITEASRSNPSFVSPT